MHGVDLLGGSGADDIGHELDHADETRIAVLPIAHRPALDHVMTRDPNDGNRIWKHVRVSAVK